MKSENGFSLIEVSVALALLSIIGFAFLGALGTISRVTLSTDERQTAGNLAEAQMEYVKGEGYAVSYDPAPIPPEYAGYTVTINATSLQDGNIQKIVVTAGRLDKAPLRLEGYKVR